MTLTPRIAIPQPTSTDPEYNERSWKLYAAAVERAGGVAVQVPLNQPQASLARLASSCEAVLLPGSAADLDPEKYGAERLPECNAKDGAREAVDDLLLQDAFNLRKPILGICYGLQSLNVWRSGKLIQDLPRFFAEKASGDPTNQKPVNHKPGRTVAHAHPVAVVPDSQLAAIVKDAEDSEPVDRQPGFVRISVNSSHHQAIAAPGDRMRIVATSPEDGVIEALEGASDGQWVLGVQWHPERTYEGSAASRAIFDAFVQAAAAWKPEPIRESQPESHPDAEIRRPGLKRPGSKR